MVVVIDPQIAGISGDMLLCALVDLGANTTKIIDGVKRSEKFLSDFLHDKPIVTPSASCAGFVKKYYDELLNYCNPEFETSIRQNAMENLLFINASS